MRRVLCICCRCCSLNGSSTAGLTCFVCGLSAGDALATAQTSVSKTSASLPLPLLTNPYGACLFLTRVLHAV